MIRGKGLCWGAIVAVRIVQAGTVCKGHLRCFLSLLAVCDDDRDRNRNDDEDDDADEQAPPLLPVA